MFITAGTDRPVELVRDDYRRARAITRRASRSFYAASHVLDAETRQAAYAVYAFCRAVDDAVDAAPTLQAAQQAIAALRMDLACVYDGIPTPHRAFADTVRRYRIPKAYFDDLLRGVEMDLTVTRFADFAELRDYCYCVASTVGLVMARIFGVNDPVALQHAEELGIAMQLTNILRDVNEDLLLGRIYLPQDELRAAGIDEQDLAHGERSDAMIAMLRAQIARARSFYLLGERGIPMIADRRAQRCVRLMSAIYGDILRVIEQNNYDVFTVRAVVPGRRKLAIALGVLTRWARRSEDPVMIPQTVAPASLDLDAMRATLERRVHDATAAVLPPSLRYTVAYSALGGKRTRGLLTMISCAAAGGNPDDALDAAAAIELLHAASLVHDDIMDEAVLRRGVTALHVRAGTSAAILSGDMLIALAMKLIRQGRAARATDLFVDAFVRACEGQGYDITMEQGHADAGTHARMVELKTASLLEAACAMGATIACDSPQVTATLAAYGNALGMAFQAKDDLLDIEGTEAVTGKSIGVDARNLRATFVTTGTAAEADAARAAVAQYTRRAIKTLAALPDSSAREHLEHFAAHLATRTH